MVAQAGPEIRDRKSLERWLDDKPAEWAQVIAVRVALRVLPLVGQVLDAAKKRVGHQKKALILAAFRACFIPWAARKYPAHGMGARALRAAAAAIVAADDAAPATRVAAALRVAARAARAAAGFRTPARAAYADDAAAANYSWGVNADTEFWQSISDDVAWLEAQEPAGDAGVQAMALIERPLWLADVRGDANYKANLPPWARAPLDRMADDPELMKAGFEHWIEWYRKIIPNRRKGTPTSYFGEALDIRIATQPKEWWDREPEDVNGDIAQGVPERYDADPPAKQPTIRQFILDYLEGRDDPASVDEIQDAFRRAGISVIRKTMRGELSRLSTAGEIKRVKRSVYAHQNYLLQTEKAVPPEPPAGPGPQYQPRDGKLSEVASLPSGDEVDPQRALHSRLRREASKLREMLARVANRYPEIANAAEEFDELVDVELADLDVTGIWSVGGSLASFASSYRDQNLTGTMSEPLEPATEAVLQNVIRHYGAFIMGFEEGRELVSRADEFAVDTKRLREIAEPGDALLAELTENTALVDERTRALHRPVRDAVTEFGWAASRTGYVAYLVVRNSVRAIIKFSVGDNPNLGAGLGVVVGGSVLMGDPNIEFVRNALPVIQTYGSQMLVFFKHSPEMRAYVEWALKVLEDDDAART